MRRKKQLQIRKKQYQNITKPHSRSWKNVKKKTRLSKNWARRSTISFFTTFLKLRLKKCKNIRNTYSPLFRTDTLKMQFSNVHRLQERVYAVESRNNYRDNLAPPIIVQFSQMKDKNSILRQAPSARKFNAAITRHLPLAFQQQRKALLEKAKRL